ncbi:MAG: hypothetical protein JWN11_624 [Hyphomicrobiales bacterium]|nr:hypothetical protein [Hyphomicrobiales bacterium]
MHVRLFARTTIVVVALLAASVATPALAHHGWAWTQNSFSKIEGVITKIYLGNPHVTLDVDVGGAIWRVELAPLGPTTAAGFTKDAAAVGDKVTAIGNRSLDAKETRMKAVRIIVKGKTYDVYPERAQNIDKPA